MATRLHIAVLAGALALAGAAAALPDPRSALPAPGRTCEPGSVRSLGGARVTYAAVVRGRATAFRRPGRGRLAVFERLNVNGVPTVLGVRGAVVDRRCRRTWYRVQLPLRPNGVVGYVRAWAVDIGRVRTRIVVDLSDRRVILYERGRRTLATPAAIGSSATPTPTGRFYVNQRLVPADPGGPFGPGAIGISAFSDVLTGWTQGGPIAIHGTNQPWSIGRAVSNGCVRVRNDVLRRLFRAAIAGTPVEIRA
jgi:lipoprotein-anchoring transpeptidase ErfK/SrfK